MEKRYQVFVSSTFADLQSERQAVIQILLNLNCIPAGMELFPASDEEQFKYIKKVIDYCDYYILIIGERYGSLTRDGISYTEKEYNYAVSKGLTILAFLSRRDGENSPAQDGEVANQKELDAFRERVADGRLVNFWTTPAQLAAGVAVSLPEAMTDFPATGWIRADRAPQEDVLADVNELRKKNDQLEAQVDALKTQLVPELQNLAGLDETFTVRLNWRKPGLRASHDADEVVKASWREIFARLSPSLVDPPLDRQVNGLLGNALLRILDPENTHPSRVDVHPDDFATVRTQYVALGLIEVKHFPTVGGGQALFWRLTAKGQRLLLESRVVRSNGEK